MARGKVKVISEKERLELEKAEKLKRQRELIEALNLIAKEKGIDKEIILEAIEGSLVTAYKSQYGRGELKNKAADADSEADAKGQSAKLDNVKAEINRETGEIRVYAIKTVVEEVTNKNLQICLLAAKDIDDKNELGDEIEIEINSMDFGRIAAGSAKGVILQKIREEEKKQIYRELLDKEKDIMTGTIQKFHNSNIYLELGRTETVLSEREQIPGERFRVTESIKVYVVEVSETAKGPKVFVSRRHPDFVKRLFENEVAEIRDGSVEIVSIAREAGSRTKMAVRTDNPDIDPVGACVGMNGSRVNAVVDELSGEKIDIINWDENPAILIENALSPAKVTAVLADENEKSATVVVPDFQLSLAIGREGQNARLAAHLTGFKIDIKSESQADEAGIIYKFDDFEYADDDYYDEDGYYEDGYYEAGEYYDEDGEYYDEDGEHYDDEAGEYDDGDGEYYADDYAGDDGADA